MHYSLTPPLVKYTLGIFLTIKTTFYLSLVKKFYVHFSIENDSISNFIDHTLMIVDPEILVTEFGMNVTPPKLGIESFFQDNR